ncbi:universal stress protein [Vagococcus intermedius]|uniref:Universal stress protein n=1 Tax=Vagococcus intermedius TaxID=2991418 RepID=A0AAF0CTD8_9ENTE|nr:universal stress protein [Vagococcus intermedius]WEG72610.1 universal stress protein [Vagococcus intermedius]WEG74695.1 universal stress protein [Vagococcus intermedius]
MLHRYERILVANDGSKNSQIAFDHAVATAIRNDAKLYILRVVDTRIDPFAPYIIEGSMEKELEKARVELSELVIKANNLGVKEAIPLLEEGAARTIIATQIPDQEEIDLLIIGATGKTGLDKLMIGSTTNYVVNHAKCPVLVIRPDMT